MGTSNYSDSQERKDCSSVPVSQLVSVGPNRLYKSYEEGLEYWTLLIQQIPFINR